MGHGTITIGEKRSGNVGRNRIIQRESTAKVDTNKIGNNEFSQDEDVKNVKLIPTIVNKRKNTSNGTNSIEDDLDSNSSQTESVAPVHVLKRIRRGAARGCKT